MANDVELFGKNYKGGIPAHLRNVEMDETTKALMGGTGSTGRRISIKGNVFRMIVNGKEVDKNEDRAMNVVIVASHPHVSRTYYEGVYKEGEMKAPDCWSDDGITSSEKSKNRQSIKCGPCPQNIAGSGQNNSRACRYSQRVAVVLEGEFDGPVYQMIFPAQSIFGRAEDGKMPLQAYVQLLVQHGLPITAVVTELRFDTNSATPKLFFKAIRPLTAEEMRIVKEQGQSDEAREAISNNAAALDSGGRTPERPPLFETPKQVEEDIEILEDDEEEEVIVPVKKVQKKAKPTMTAAEESATLTPKDQTKVGSILDEWDDL